jgi:hypothetical protein
MNPPSHLPPLPAAPEGHEWVYRGKGFTPTRRAIYAICEDEYPTRWDSSAPVTFKPMGVSCLHYAEAVPISAAVPPDQGGDVTTPQHVPAAAMSTIKWTSTPPTYRQLGWYWHRFSESHKPAIIEVFIDEGFGGGQGALSVRTGDGIDDTNFIENYSDKGSQWAGPIPEPQ